MNWFTIIQSFSKYFKQSLFVSVVQWCSSLFPYELSRLERLLLVLDEVFESICLLAFIIDVHVRETDLSLFLNELCDCLSLFLHDVVDSLHLFTHVIFLLAWIQVPKHQARRICSYISRSIDQSLCQSRRWYSSGYHREAAALFAFLRSLSRFESLASISSRALAIFSAVNETKIQYSFTLTLLIFHLFLPSSSRARIIPNFLDAFVFEYSRSSIAMSATFSYTVHAQYTLINMQDNFFIALYMILRYLEALN